MTLLQFLRNARQVHLEFLAGTLAESPIYVLGNPSADLDSIISSIVYSYYANNRRPNTTPRPHIPLINLPNVPSDSELYRLRPEFVTAFWLSTNFPALSPEDRFENASESAGKVLRKHLMTVADFAADLKERSKSGKIVANAMLVDWNAMPIRDEQKGTGSVSGLENVSFRAVGCIDHHVNEDFMPPCEELPQGQPLIIQPGPGSCASLITDELNSGGFWDVSSAPEKSQIAKLALAAILIDTSNLTAKGKVTDVDVQSVGFLQRCISSLDHTWSMVGFYEQILTAKQNSLDLLTFEEVLDRDYKDWTESTDSSKTSLKLGFCSSVKPMRWLIQKAGGCQRFLEGIRSFATSDDKQLDIVVVMTSFTSADEQFARELFVGATGNGDVSVDALNAFIEQSSTQLGLEDWSYVDSEKIELDEGEIRSSMDGKFGIWTRLWIQTNSTASRKQVAPMLRSAVAKL